MGWAIFWIILAVFFATGVYLTDKYKYRAWISKRLTGMEIKKQKQKGAILIDSDKLKTSNAFTDSLDETLRNGRWYVQEAPFTVRYSSRNLLGQIAGLIIRFDVYMNNIRVEYFEKMIPNIKADEDIEFKTGVAFDLDLVNRAKKSAGLPKQSIVDFHVVVRSFELYIPESNPLYESDSLRDAVGLPRVEKEKTYMEEYAELSAAMPQRIRSQTDAIMVNIKKMENAAEGSLKLQSKVNRFTDKYIPLINDVLKAYKNTDSSAEGDGEIDRTLATMIKGSENFLRQIQAKGELDSEIAMTVIEQQLIADGLIDPMENNI